MIEIIVIRRELVAMVIRGKLYFSPTLDSQHRVMLQLPIRFSGLRYFTADWRDGYIAKWEYTG